jgi:hypothetical protein
MRSLQSSAAGATAIANKALMTTLTRLTESTKHLIKRLPGDVDKFSIGLVLFGVMSAIEPRVGQTKAIVERGGQPYAWTTDGPTLEALNQPISNQSSLTHVALPSRDFDAVVSNL